MKQLLSLTLFLLFVASLHAQDRIARLTYSIVDTSKSQTEQVRAIYGWITNNIAYDAKQYAKGNRKHYSSEQVLRRKKTMCQGYAELFSEMCRRIGVESYNVYGYSKGFGYIKGEDFYKADHAWNVCLTDSSWLIVDATWGSGYLDYDYTFWTKVRMAITKKEGIRTKLKFVPRPTNEYFALAPEEAIKTHFPLDSKWQLQPNAIPYGTFVFDSTLAAIPVDFVDGTYISRVRGVSYSCFLDGVNSIKYNPINHFDIAYQYYKQATALPIDATHFQDSSIISVLDTAIHYYELSLGYIKDFRTIRRDTYTEKRLRQGTTYRAASRSSRALAHIPTTPNGKYPREEKRYTRMERSLDKALQSADAGAMSYALGARYTFDAPAKRDTSTFADLRKRIAESFATYTFNVSVVENKLPALIAVHAGDTLLNERIVPHLDSATSRLLRVGQTLDNMDEFAFFSHCDTLANICALYDTSLAKKEKVKVNLAKTYGEFSLSFALAESSLKRILRSYERMAKKSGDNEKYSALASQVARRLNQLYLYKVQAVSVMIRNTRSWHRLADMSDNELAVFGPSGITDLSSRMALFYSHVSSRNATMYGNDMVISQTIKNAARNNLSATKKLAKVLKKEQMAAKRKR